MARLIDDIRVAKQMQPPFWLDDTRRDLWEKHAQWVMDVLREDLEMPVMVVDKVAEYYFSGTDQEYWDLGRHFPNLTPPFSVWWTEHRMAHKIRSSVFGETWMTDHGSGPLARLGILWCASTEFEGEGIPDNVKWMLMAEIFLDYDVSGKDIEGPSGTWMLAIDEHGAIVESPVLQCYSAPKWNEILAECVTLLHPSLLAVSGMNELAAREGRVIV